MPLLCLSLTFNYTHSHDGKSQKLDGDPDTPLLWMLRDELDLKGTKFGCGMGLCGACTVHLNSKPIRSCSTPVSAAANATVTTIEGISSDGSHPVQVAWLELDVPQCSYCQAGQIMSACALLAKTPKPNDVEIDEAMKGNLCRCGTYLRIRAAVHKAAEMTPAKTANKPAANTPGKTSTVIPA